MTQLTFGSREAAIRALRDIHQCHRRVYGTVAETAGCPQGGKSYDASDPPLKLWVLATLTDSNLCLHDLFVRPLSSIEKEAYYRDSLRMGRLLGIPQEQMPSDFAAFSRYVQWMEREVLSVGNDARRVAEALFAPTLLGRLVRLSSYVSVGLLPERLRQAYQLSWNARDQERLLRLAAFSRRLRSRLPNCIGVNPHASLAEIRFRKRWMEASLAAPDHPDSALKDGPPSQAGHFIEDCCQGREGRSAPTARRNANTAR
jgi:uncharacterized protein (DUF2236 family)